MVIVPQLLIPSLCESLLPMQRPRVGVSPGVVVLPMRSRALPRQSVQTSSQRRARTLSFVRLVGIGLSDKNFETGPGLCLQRATTLPAHRQILKEVIASLPGDEVREQCRLACVFLCHSEDAMGVDLED